MQISKKLTILLRKKLPTNSTYYFANGNEVSSSQDFLLGTKGKVGKPGRLAVRLYSLKTKDWVKVTHTVSKERAPGSYKFSLSPLGAQGEATADLEKGTINCTDGGTVHGGIMGMALALLHVLLQPRLTPRSDVDALVERFDIEPCPDFSAK